MKTIKIKWIAALLHCLVFANLPSFAQTVLLNKNFTGNVLPSGWYQDSLGFPPVVSKWKFSGFPNAVVGYGFDNNYIRIVQSPDTNDCSLITNTFDASMVSSAYLSYGEWYRGGSWLNLNLFIRIEASNDGGNSWNVVFTNYSYGHMGLGFGANRKVIDLSQYIAGSSNAKIKFHFRGSNSGAWAIDSVVVSDNEPCTQPTDTTGITANNHNFCCTGSPVNLSINNLSQGVGQTYQWQYDNGGGYTNISGAVYDTLTYTQNSNTYYKCIVVCGSDTAHTVPLYVPDLPYTATSVVSLNDIGVCSGRDDTLSLISEKNIPGIVYQWQSSWLSPTSFVDIPSATDTIYVVSAANYSADTYFRCNDICASNMQIHNSAYVAEYKNLNTACYCIPDNSNQCPPTSSLYYGTIVKVEIPSTTLSNATGFCNNAMGSYNNYSFFPPSGSTTALLSRNTNYTIAVTNDSVATLNFAMWIDYNHNGDFDNNEYTLIHNNVAPDSIATATFTVPANAVPGLTGMRVRSYLYRFGTSACSYMAGGETEDYLITIDTATGISNIEQGMLGVEVFPNPAKDELTVRSNESGVRSVEIENVVGEKVFSLRTPNSKLQTKIDVSNLAPGIYFVKVATDRGCVVRKFVKE